MVIEIARWLLCESHNTEPTCRCRACEQFAAKTYPDFICIAPEEKNHSVKINQIRMLSDQLTRSAYYGGYRIVIIAPADAMPMNAANGLLKTLEEPPEKTIIFLIDDQKHPLLKTIVSRCQVFTFNQNDAIKNQDKQLQGELLRYLEKIILFEKNLVLSAAPWAKRNLSELLDSLLLIFMDIARVQQQVAQSFLIDPENLVVIKNISQKISQEKVFRTTRKIIEKKRYVAAGINLNTQLCLEGILTSVFA